MKPIIVALSLLLVACSVPQAPTAPEPAQVQAAPPVAPMTKRAAGDMTLPLQVFRAFGTEPFWGINVEGAHLTYTTPEDPAGQVMQGQRRALDGGVEISGSHAGKPFALTVMAGDCSDGMSDNQYRLVSAFRYGDIAFKGCAEAAK